MTKTYSPKPPEITREWYVVDAAGQTLGRVATEVARLLRGKHKPIYSPHMDTGDYVIILNAKDIVLTGNKPQQKLYIHHTMHPQGFRETNFLDRVKRHPTWPLEEAIRGMLPHNRLGRAMAGKLKVYAGSEHPHQAQAPKVYNLEYTRSRSE
jgi:large subunit ribosomal protein L13